MIENGEIKTLSVCGEEAITERWASGGDMYMVKCSNPDCAVPAEGYPSGRNLIAVREQWKGMVKKMSFMSEVIREGYANTSSSEALKEQFNKFCNWCWGHSCGNCDICRREYHKLYIPLRIAEKQKELGLSVTRNKEDTKC